MKPETLNALVAQHLAIEAEEARQAGALGFMARALAQATLPHRKVEGTEFVRRNGAFSLSLQAPSFTGLPYGSIPRLLLAWISTEAVRTKSRDLVLGESLSEFMRQLDLVPTGGRWGTITRLRDQATRLFASRITCLYADRDRTAIRNFLVADEAVLWWSPKAPGQGSLWQSTLALSQPFFEEITQHPVPIDMRVLKALKRSPMALDTYVWLTHRMSYLRKPTAIPWQALSLQFGADYSRLRDFKAAFQVELKKVLGFYRQASVKSLDHGLLLSPSPTHIGRQPDASR